MSNNNTDNIIVQNFKIHPLVPPNGVQCPHFKGKLVFRKGQKKKEYKYLFWISYVD